MPSLFTGKGIIVLIFIVIISILIKTYDIRINDLGRSVAPFNLMWQKDNQTPSEVSEVMFECRQENKVTEQMSLNYRIELNSYCMIQKGFIFSPRGNGNYLNWCGGSRDKTVACLFYDGKIILNQQGEVVWKKTGAEVRIDEEGIVK